MDEPAYDLIRWHCGHEGHVGFSRWLHRDEVLRRTKCSACGGKQERDLRVLPGPGAGKAYEKEVAGVRVHQV